MAFTVIGDWKMEDGEATVENGGYWKYYDMDGTLHWINYEREILTKKYTCFCRGEEDLPERQNPGNLMLPWRCMSRHFTNPRGDYKIYEEIWQVIGDWQRTHQESSSSSSGN